MSTKPWLWNSGYSSEARGHALEISCKCIVERKPCSYHEGFDEGVELMKEMME